MTPVKRQSFRFFISFGLYRSFHQGTRVASASLQIYPQTNLRMHGSQASNSMQNHLFNAQTKWRQVVPCYLITWSPNASCFASLRSPDNIPVQREHGLIYHLDLNISHRAPTMCGVLKDLAEQGRCTHLALSPDA
jgi:hypothetical protein